MHWKGTTLEYRHQIGKASEHYCRIDDTLVYMDKIGKTQNMHRIEKAPEDTRRMQKLCVNVIRTAQSSCYKQKILG